MPDVYKQKHQTITIYRFHCLSHFMDKIGFHFVTLHFLPVYHHNWRLREKNTKIIKYILLIIMFHSRDNTINLFIKYLQLAMYLFNLRIIKEKYSILNLVCFQTIGFLDSVLKKISFETNLFYIPVSLYL